MRTSPREVRRPTWLLLLVITLVVVFQLMQSRRLVPAVATREAVKQSTIAPELAKEQGERASPPGFGAEVGFRSRQRLLEHFDKHGAESGSIDAAAYLALAQALRDAPVGGPVLEAVRADGVVCRFDRRDGTFIAFDEDGTLRTCFRPNDGERYFQRQARRPADRP